MLPLGIIHLVQHAIPREAGIVYQHVKTTARIQGCVGSGVLVLQGQ